jgi:hypothetical protein
MFVCSLVKMQVGLKPPFAELLVKKDAISRRAAADLSPR